MTRLARYSQLAIVGFLVTFSLTCVDEEQPTAPDVAGPSPTISDAAHDVRDHFYFLPPLVADPEPTGEFDPSFLPYLAVVVCEWDGTECVEPPIADFSSETGPGSETLRIDEDDEHYIVNWHTKDSNLDPDKMYRIRVLAGEVELGFADVDVVSKGSQLKSVDTGEFIALKDGRTLPIKFRIQEGILGVEVVGSGGGTVTDATGSVSVTVPPGAVDRSVLLQVELDPSGALPITGRPAVTILRAAKLEPTGLLLDSPAQVVWRYSALPAGVAASEVGVLHWREDGIVEEVVSAEFNDADETITFELQSFSRVGLFKRSHPWAVMGKRWKARTLKWYWEQQTSFTYYSPDEIQSALDEWGAATSGFTFVRTNQESQANIRFYEVGVITHADNLITGSIGIGNLCEGRQIFFDGYAGITCFFRYEDNLESDDWVVVQLASETMRGAFYWDGAANKVLRHEVGHALGVDHPYDKVRGGDRPVMQWGRFERPGLHPWDVEAIQFIYDAPQAGNTLSAGFGTPTIDGVRTPGEWDAAGRIVVGRAGPLSNATIYAMNDASNLYLALEVPDATLTVGDAFVIRFDNEGNGQADEGDDNLSVGLFGFFDAYWEADEQCEPPAGCYGWGYVDQQQHGTGAVGRMGGVNFFELAHPLSSGDSQDFALYPGASVPFCVYLFTDTGGGPSFPPGCKLHPYYTIEMQNYGLLITASGP